MKRLVLLWTTLAGMLVLGISTTPAYALPDVSIALCTGGGCYPLRVGTTVTGGLTNLSSAGSTTFFGEGFLLLLHLPELTALSTFEALLAKVRTPGASPKECNSEGDAAGEVLLKGTFHVVYTALTSLALGILYLVEPLNVACGEDKVQVKGNVLSSLNGGTEGTELTSILGLIAGNERGVPKLKTYFNAAGASATAKLEVDSGIGFAEAALEIDPVCGTCRAAEVTLLALESKMFTITGR
jgi:hypothetical protein